MDCFGMYQELQTTFASQVVAGEVLRSFEIEKEKWLQIYLGFYIVYNQI